MSKRRQDRLCQGNFAASVKAILPIADRGFPGTISLFRLILNELAEKAWQSPLTHRVVLA